MSLLKDIFEGYKDRAMKIFLWVALVIVTACIALVAFFGP